MIGTADEIVKAPEKGPVFVEDLPEEEQAVALVHNDVYQFVSYYFLAFDLLNS